MLQRKKFNARFYFGSDIKNHFAIVQPLVVIIKFYC